MGAFADSVRANAEKAKNAMNDKSYEIATTFFKEVVNRTPVLDGYLINSWYTMTGLKFSSAITPTPDKSGSGSLMNIESLKQARAFYGKDGIVTMANNLPYAYRIEYLGWSQYKAPQGMVRISLINVAARYK